MTAFGVALLLLALAMLVVAGAMIECENRCLRERCAELERREGYRP